MGVPGPKVPYNLWGADVVLCAKFQLFGFICLTTYKGQLGTHTHTHASLYELKRPLCKIVFQFQRQTYQIIGESTVKSWENGRFNENLTASYINIRISCQQKQTGCLHEMG